MAGLLSEALVLAPRVHISATNRLSRGATVDFIVFAVSYLDKLWVRYGASLPVN